MGNGADYSFRPYTKCVPKCVLFFCRFSRYIRRLPLHDIGCWSAALKGLSKGTLFFYQAIHFVLIVDLWALAGRRRREFGARAGPKKSFWRGAESFSFANEPPTWYPGFQKHGRRGRGNYYYWRRGLRVPETCVFHNSRLCFGG